MNNPFIRWLGNLLGYENVEAITSWKLTFAASWARAYPPLVLFGCVALAVVAFAFYIRRQQKVSWNLRVAFAVSRAVLLALLLVILAEPILELTRVSTPRPLLWLVFDGTDSMNIEDELSENERRQLAEAVALAETADSDSEDKPSRMQYLQALLKKDDGELLEKLNEKFRLRAFLFDHRDGVRQLELPREDGEFDPQVLTSQISSEGEVTALGTAMEDLASRQGTANLAGLVVFSDFDQNAGPDPWEAAARFKKANVPVYAVGIGPKSALDLGVDLKTELVMKKAERSDINVYLKQHGLDGTSVKVKVRGRRMSGEDMSFDESFLVEERDVELSGPEVAVSIPYTPEKTGRFLFEAEVDPLDGEVVDQNNRSEREVNIRDDFLRLMYVEYEPTWEWRFIKEVFHRDKLVGMRGFRTFLRSADTKVKQHTDVFLPTLAPARSEFFANDVIFLGDMPAPTLSTRFCEMTKEFVEKFGGGLVVIAGPRFGPGELAQTPLADMLPVVVNPDGRVRDTKDFHLQLTPEADQVSFMQLGADEQEHRKAWNNLGALPWYQPVDRVHPLGVVLAEHPADYCVDNKTRQPLIAMRRYGRGTVMYLGFNETWRLRRKYGEKYYRQFWGQMIYALGLRRDLGSQKRFVVRVDRQPPKYQADETVIVTVEAYDSNFNPLTEEDLPNRKLVGEHILPVDSGERSTTQELSLPLLREGVFEARMRVFEGGEHRIRVQDPETGEYNEVAFQVESLSAERRSAVRNVALQQRLALDSEGKSYTLVDAHQLPDDIKFVSRPETTLNVNPLWNTQFAYVLIVLLMLGEWLFRKLVNLP